MRIPLVFTLLCVFLVHPGIASGTALESTLVVGAGEEYNSNVNERPNAQGDWLTVLSAVGSAIYESSRVTATATIDGTYNIYALGNHDDEFKGKAQIKATAMAIPELLAVEAEGQFQQVYANLARGETNPTDSTRNQVNQNAVTGRVYLTPHLSDRLDLKLGYQFTAYFYNDPSLDKRRNSLFAQSSYELSPSLKLLVDAMALRQDAQGAWLERVVASAGVRWDYSSTGLFEAKAGPRFTRYDYGEFSVEPYWEAKLTQTLGAFQAVLDTSSTYTENPSSPYGSRKTGAGSTLILKRDRTTLSARAGYSYLDGPDTQDSSQVSLAFTAAYELTPRLSLRASGTREFSQTSSKGLTRWYADGAAVYELDKGFSVEGYFKWKLSDSSNGGRDNYFVNIVGLRLKKTF